MEFTAIHGGELWATADSYKARFAADGVAFYPYFGPDAPRTSELLLVLESVTAGTDELPLTPATIAHAGTTVSLARGVVTERYELAPGQMEQTFLFASRPTQGDLVLRLRLRTDLAGSGDESGLCFRSPFGHVTYSRAVLADARGRRTTAQTHLRGDTVELRVAAADVADAAFPVVVDPVLRAFSVATDTSYHLFAPDVAFCANTGRYLVAYERMYSSTDTDVYSVEMDRNGIVAGSGLWIDVSTDSWTAPRVAFQSLHGKFLVVAERLPVGGGQRAIWGRVRDATSGALTAPFQISGSESGAKHKPDVGGDCDGSPPSYFAVVWQRDYSSSDTDIHYRLVAHDGILVGASTQLIDNSASLDLEPRIANSRRDGSSAAWNVVWTRRAANNSLDICGARLGWNGALLTPTWNIDPDPVADDQSPVVSSLTDPIAGRRYFLVAYETSTPLSDRNIFVRIFEDAAVPVPRDSGWLATAEGLVPPIRTRDQIEPVVDSDGCRFAIAYLERISSFDQDAYLTTVHMGAGGLQGFGATEARVALEFSSRFASGVALCSNRSGLGSPWQYSAVWASADLTNPIRDDIEVAVYEGLAAGGFSFRPTGCAGLTLSPGREPPALGANLVFAVGGTTNPRFLVLSVPAPALPLCVTAPCQIGVDLRTLVTFPTASASFQVPCQSHLIGALLAIQGGAIGMSGGCAIFSGVALTDTCDMTIR